MEKIYENIKLLRKAKNISQATLAEMTGYNDRSSIAKIEKGGVDIPRSKIILFAKALGVTPGELIGEVPSEEELRNSLSPSQLKLYERIISLPEDLLLDILDYIDYKLGQYNRKSLQQDDQE